MVLPSGFSLPPLPYLLALLVADGAAIWLLRRRRPPISDRLVLGFLPWIVTGSALHAVYQVDAAPDAIRPLLGTPAVYLTTFAAAAAVWLLADARGGDRTPAALAAVGTVAFAVALLGLLAGAGSIRPVWSAASLALAGALAAAIWAGLDRIDPEATAATGGVGALAVFGHALDGVSTAVGVDVLGFGERTPASRLVMEVAGALPTAEWLGVGWLFVLVKIAVAVLVVKLFVGYVREEPGEGYLLLGAIAAVGLGPGAHNLLLYLVR